MPRRQPRRVGLSSVEGQHWSHLTPDVQSGDDAVFNLIRASERVNVSYMKSIDKLDVPADAVVRIEVVFDNAIDAYQRHAQSVTYRVVKGDEVLDHFNFVDPVQTPVLTYSQLRGMAKGLLARLQHDPEYDWQLQAIQKIIEFLLTGRNDPGL